MRIFADTFALIEYFKGSKKHADYFESGNTITTKLNLMEL